MKLNSQTLKTSLRRFARQETGAALVEYAIVLPLFLLLLLGVIDFGRYSGKFVMVQKALERGARVAAVRPAICAGVPQTHTRAPVVGNAVPPKFGTSCSAGNVCANPGTITCPLDTNNATGAEIWNRIAAVMPNGVVATQVSVSYAYDQNLGFVGGPYVPLVTVELTTANFDFVTPLGALATLASGIVNPNGAPSGTVPFPAMSVTLPGEDLNLGNNG